MEYKPPAGVGIWRDKAKKCWRVRVGAKFLGKGATPYTKLFPSGEDGYADAVKYCRGLTKKRSPDVLLSKKLELSRVQVADVDLALAKLAGRATLQECVLAWEEKMTRTKSRPVGGWIDLYETHLKNQTFVARSKTEPIQKLKRMFKGRMEVPILEVTWGFINQTIFNDRDANGITPSVQQKTTRLRYLKSFFSYVGGEDVTFRSPIPPKKRAPISRASVVVIPCKDVAALLVCCRKHFPEFLPTLAIKLFSGIRNPEVCGLTWGCVLKDEFFVSKAFSKTKKDRSVTIYPNLWSWLEEAKKGKGDDDLIFSLSPKAKKRIPLYLEAFRLLKEKARVTVTQNGLRHCFGSYHYARFRSFEKTSSEMGNSPSTVDQYYTNAVRKCNWETFWKIDPSNAIYVAKGEDLIVSGKPGVLDAPEPPHDE